MDEFAFKIECVHNSLLMSPSHNHELPLGGSAADVSPQVHGENSTGTVEYGGQRGHESSQHHSHH